MLFRSFWLEDWEKQVIVTFHLKNPLEGYRRLTFMMLDGDVVAVSPSSVWRVLSQTGLLSKWNGAPPKKGTGFQQPPAPHQHWHIDVSYINIAGTFYYLCSVLDGYSRYSPLKNPRFLLGNAVNSVSEQLRVVDTQTGYTDDFGLNYISAVQPATQAGFNNGNINIHIYKMHKRQGCHDLEESGRIGL